MQQCCNKFELGSTCPSSNTKDDKTIEVNRFLIKFELSNASENPSNSSS